jgi:hypothetical protein
MSAARDYCDDGFDDGFEFDGDGTVDVAELVTTSALQNILYA